MNTIRGLVNQGIKVLQQMRINYNSTIGPNTMQLINISRQLIPNLQKEQPEIADILNNALSSINFNGFISAYSFGDIRTCYRILASLYNHPKKIFISHSSEDKDIVNGFVKEILIAIRTGDDFRNEIVKNMKGCDFILCMISENYKRSEVCTNEMGAAWAMDGKRILPFKFPYLSFNDMGFLNVVKQGADITDKSKLDELYTELCAFYDLSTDWINYNQRTADFIQLVNSKTGHN
ncbi:MAG: toll/interleukin-1 receptor domain-containing protein [Phocaeicola dorei]|nr:toll/interleukin-1 receptor domain-containing protein [Phocaeicola dorei]